VDAAVEQVAGRVGIEQAELGDSAAHRRERHSSDGLELADRRFRDRGVPRWPTAAPSAVSAGPSAALPVPAAMYLKFEMDAPLTRDPRSCRRRRWSPVGSQAFPCLNFRGGSSMYFAPLNCCLSFGFTPICS
jgi:hypothetical protein